MSSYRTRLPFLFVSFTFVLLTFVHPVFAYRHARSLPGSSNGAGTLASEPAATCIDSDIRPFLVALNGRIKNTSRCTTPVPPEITYPDFSGATLTSSDPPFTLNILPLIWQDNQLPDSKYTVFHLTLSTTQIAPTLTLKSFIIGKVLENPNYMTCDENGDALWGVTDPSNTSAPNSPFCTTSPVFNGQLNFEAQEPTPITQADGTTTRWDFTDFNASSQGATVDLVVDGFPNDFHSFDTAPHDNGLTAPFFTSANFLAVVEDSTGTVFRIGGLSLTPLPNQPHPAPANDILQHSENIPFPSFIETVDTSNALPALDNSLVLTSDQGDPKVLVVDPCDASLTLPSSLLRTVWYSYTPTSTGAIHLDTSRSRYDTLLAIFAGSATSPLAQEDEAPNSETLQATLDFTPTLDQVGKPLRILVGETPAFGCAVDNQGNSFASLLPLSNDASLSFSLVRTALPQRPLLPQAYRSAPSRLAHLVHPS